jgi:hypothetical protein
MVRGGLYSLEARRHKLRLLKQRKIMIISGGHRFMIFTKPIVRGAAFEWRGDGMG